MLRKHKQEPGSGLSLGCLAEVMAGRSVGCGSSQVGRGTEFRNIKYAIKAAGRSEQPVRCANKEKERNNSKEFIVG